MKTTYIIGHRKPDTDAVVSSIALSYLKNQVGIKAEPKVIGDINKETSFVLNYWKIKTPDSIEDVKVQIKDINYRKNLMINETSSIYDAYSYMIDNNTTGIPVVKAKNKLRGYVSLREIAASTISGEFDRIKTYYTNILKVLNGKEVLKFDEEIEGKIVIAANSIESCLSNIDENAIVIADNRKHIIDYCIDMKVKLIILIENQKITVEEERTANKNKVNIIKSSKSLLEISKIIVSSNYVSSILRNEDPVVLNPNDYLTDFYEINNKVKHTNYPIVDNKNTCKGLLRLLDINNYEKKDVILVDHNDIDQSVYGLNEANIIEIIDHHALGNLTTNTPVSFRNMNVGSTSTIIYYLFMEAKVKIPKSIAGIMLSGILSDTLMLKSPTTTEIDKNVVNELSKIAKVNYKKYGLEMLKAGSSLQDLTVEEVVFYDYKEYKVNNVGFGIGQILTLDYEQILKNKEEYINFLDKVCEIKGFKIMALFVTDVVSNGSYILYSTNAKQIISLAFNKDNMVEGYYLDGIVSRKKQIVPNIIDEIENSD